MTFILYLIISYIILTFLLARLFIPYLGFKKAKIPSKIPLELETDIKKINEKSKTDTDFLKNAYDFVTSKYHGYRLETVLKFNYLFKDPLQLKSGFLPCTLQNYLLRTILVKSGRFSDKNIKVVVVPFNLILHQYLKIKIGDKDLLIDPWSSNLGKQFGKRSIFFG